MQQDLTNIVTAELQENFRATLAVGLPSPITCFCLEEHKKIILPTLSLCPEGS